MPVSKYFISNGDKFGSWEVIEANKKNSKSLVRCSCGFEKLISNGDLATGRSRSCGKRGCIKKFVDLTNLKFGFLIALSKTELRASNGSIIWNCECICGKICQISSKHLLSGGSKSCGCKSSNLRLDKIGVLSDEDRSVNRIIDGYKRGAKERKLEFALSIEEFKKFITANCHYCGTPPSKIVTIKKTHDTISFNYNGIDRVDSKRGYIKSNCVTACWFCNRAKLDATEEEFSEWIKRIIDFNK